ncbi:winged helix-turn-helix domain-containing protein [Pseudomonas benzenivorans]|uniref:Response regulator transcription factor n=1 Tax=Pseudomonas benzenivorans TaxID=556533 RepID=A0ABY5HD64_9PSED|nr:response regulator transcription factor [Pseudomonas benzenivorans]
MTPDLNTGLVEATQNSATICNEAWTLDYERRVLSRARQEITLTKTEVVILQSFVVREQRALNKSELFACLGKKPDSYTGLNMCIYRLQSKFNRHADGADLFRSIRHRGYCLVQEIKIRDQGRP